MDNILIATMYFVGIGIVLGIVASFVGSAFNFTGMFKALFRFFQK
ncbi:hypothetical protein [Clostridium cylindrosporum]|uniref:Uncharacterized protein n=1 Tax=Clostridium cylindrosporum DSM 605 TaxID=1121307 RepID=A0A0J8D8L7_CLOCY|nr:hypothetical protein [Clostridium cylindrosporum]KMT22227.1 hypothetical protein CLCY_4c02000 [Clostridium cylindrosporum DSM 605]